MATRGSTQAAGAGSFLTTGLVGYLLVFSLAGVGAYLIALRFEGQSHDLAKHHVDTHQTRLEAVAKREYDKARKAAERGRLRLVQAQAEFDALLDRHFEQYRLRTEELADLAAAEAAVPTQQEPPKQEPPKDPAPGPSLGTAARTRTRMVENPARAETDRELARLKQYRLRLLIDRTAEHPEVHEADVEIAQLQKRLSSIPEKIASEQLEQPEEMPPSPGLATEEPVAQTPPAETVTAETVTAETVTAETLRGRKAGVAAFHTRKAALDRVRQKYEQLAQIERRTRRGRVRPAGLDLRLAQRSEVSRPKDHHPESLLIALIGAVVVTAVVGMISAVLGANPTFTTVAQVEANLPVPVVGVVPNRLRNPAH